MFKKNGKRRRMECSQLETVFVFYDFHSTSKQFENTVDYETSLLEFVFICIVHVSGRLEITPNFQFDGNYFQIYPELYKNWLCIYIKV